MLKEKKQVITFKEYSIQLAADISGETLYDRKVNKEKTVNWEFYIWQKMSLKNKEGFKTSQINQISMISLPLYLSVIEKNVKESPSNWNERTLPSKSNPVKNIKFSEIFFTWRNGSDISTMAL